MLISYDSLLLAHVTATVAWYPRCSYVWVTSVYAQDTHASFIFGFGEGNVFYEFSYFLMQSLQQSFNGCSELSL